jgi:AraC-like DNA-binding protein/quercetin dioxygenase-like cupin family protein
MPRQSRRAFDPGPRHQPTLHEPVTVGLRCPPPDSVIQLHKHSFGQLACPLHGSIRLVAAGMSWIVPVLRTVWVPPNVEHELTMLGNVQFHAIYIDPKVAPLPAAKCSVLQVSGLMRALIQTLADHHIAGRKRHKLLMALLLEEVRIAPPLALGLPLPTDRRLKALCDALIEDPASSKSLADWAKWVGASERTLARIFETELQMSFGVWRRQLLLEKAIDLIGRGMPIARVANDLGYANAAAFSTMFKRVFGVPPSQFNMVDQ